VDSQRPGSLLDTPLAVQGEVPVIARRLAEVAAPGRVVASEATHALLRGLFVAERLGGGDGDLMRAGAFDVIGERRPQPASGSHRLDPHSTEPGSSP
jgi:class 3 adenylate cyclase